VALLVAGCGSSSDDGASGNSASSKGKPSGKPARKVTAPASTSKPVDPPATSTPPPSPSPTPVTASDGTRYSACADGTCEVAVSRPVRIAVEGGTLSVTKVKPEDSMGFELTFASGGGGSGTLKGTCGAVFTFYRGGGAGASSCGTDTSAATPPAPEPGALLMQLAGWNSDGAAVLRLVSG
jgi:hypothetical protein